MMHLDIYYISYKNLLQNLMDFKRGVLFVQLFSLKQITLYLYGSLGHKAD